MSHPRSLPDWDSHAADYQRLFAPYTGYVARAMVRMVETRIPAGASILDIACGPGDLAVEAGALLRRTARGAEAGRTGGAGGRVLALDRSPRMVALAGEAARNAGLGPLVTCREGDGLALEVEDGSFDAAFSSFGIFLFPDRRQGWAEAARALRPGGSFATSVWRSAEHNEIARIQVETLRGTLPSRLTDGWSGPDWENLFTPEGLADEVVSSGPFEDPRVSVIDATLALPSPAAMWEGVQGNPVTGRVLAQCTPEELVPVREALLARFEEAAGGPDRPLLLGCSAHVLVVRRGEG